MTTDRLTILALARERLGYDQLRPGQEQAVAAAASGRDVIAVLPTGGGKSAIYELAGLLRQGPTVVVSPLIALQDDQLAHLRAAGLRATVLNSAQSAGARAAALVDACGPDEFIFLSPEQLSNDQTRAALQRARPGLFVVDEAHLVSQWGSDFRPDYLRLGAQADDLRVGVRIALTATAAPPVRLEICRRLGLNDPEVVIGDFDRPHIELSVRQARSPEDKQQLVARYADQLRGAGIVYAATHAGAEEARETLAAAGEHVTLYHAGLGAAARRRAMTEFLPRDRPGSSRQRSRSGWASTSPTCDGCSTPTRLPPSTPTTRSSGRAGRDGDRADAVLLYRPEDIGAARHLTARGVSEAAVADAAQRLVAGGVVEVGSRPATLALTRRVDVGAAAWRADGRARWTGTMDLAAALAASREESQREREVERSRLDMMRRYAETTGCRRSFLLSYFGQEYSGPCGACDNDRRHAAARPSAKPFPIGVRVASERWGVGTIQRYDGDQVTVLFDEHGYRDLLVPLVVERRLLTRA